WAKPSNIAHRDARTAASGDRATFLANEPPDAPWRHLVGYWVRQEARGRVVAHRAWLVSPVAGRLCWGACRRWRAWEASADLSIFQLAVSCQNLAVRMHRAVFEATQRNSLI